MGSEMCIRDSYSGALAEPGGREVLPFFLSRSNHLLVRPSIDGEPIDGMMILDSGASGYVITRELADELELEAFGELYVSGVTQKVRSQFRRSRTLSLGGVTQEHPLFMELPLDGVVNGAPDRVVGILGYDIFRRVVVEVPALREAPAGSTPAAAGGPPIRRVGVAAALGDGGGPAPEQQDWGRQEGGAGAREPREPPARGGQPAAAPAAAQGGGDAQAARGRVGPGAARARHVRRPGAARRRRGPWSGHLLALGAARPAAAAPASGGRAGGGCACGAKLGATRRGRIGRRVWQTRCSGTR